MDKLTITEFSNQVCWGIYCSSDKLAVAIAVDRNVKTATKDLIEKRGSPQSPCPLVQPFERSVPKPTNSPATAKWVTEEDDVNWELSKGRFIVLLNSGKFL